MVRRLPHAESERQTSFDLLAMDSLIAKGLDQKVFLPFDPAPLLRYLLLFRAVLPKNSQ